jgi:hypothetical protein
VLAEESRYLDDTLTEELPKELPAGKEAMKMSPPQISRKYLES